MHTLQYEPLIYTHTHTHILLILQHNLTHAQIKNTLGTNPDANRKYGEINTDLYLESKETDRI